MHSQKRVPDGSPISHSMGTICLIRSLLLFIFEIHYPSLTTFYAARVYRAAYTNHIRFGEEIQIHCLPPLTASVIALRFHPKWSRAYSTFLIFKYGYCIVVATVEARCDTNDCISIDTLVIRINEDRLPPLMASSTKGNIVSSLLPPVFIFKICYICLVGTACFCRYTSHGISVCRRVVVATPVIDNS